LGRFGATLRGALTLKPEQQTGYGGPFISNLGKFSTDDVVHCWRHGLTLDSENGPRTLALSSSFISGHDDRNSDADTNIALVVAPIPAIAPIASFASKPTPYGICRAPAPPPRR